MDKEVNSTRIKNGSYVDCLRELESTGLLEEDLLEDKYKDGRIIKETLKEQEE